MSVRNGAGGGDGRQAGPGRRTVAATAALGAALLLTGGCGTARTRPGGRHAGHRRDVVPRLPAPTGPYRLGVTTLYLVDPSRHDPWDHRLTRRELMITVRYPARTVAGHPVAPQMTPGAAQVFAGLDPRFHPGLPTSGVDWTATRTHAHTDAPAQPVRRPVLLHTPGGGDPRTLGTGLAEELASHGWVVVSIDHPGDAGEVEFPVTTPQRPAPVRTTVFRGDPRTDPDLFRTMIDTRLADTRFVRTQLAELAAGRNPDAAGRPLPDGLGHALDVRRMGIYGHSAGGTTAAQALHDDRCLRAAINLEGYLDHPSRRPGQAGPLFPVARHGVDRPLLLVGTDGFPGRKELARSWSALLAHPHGRIRRRQIRHTAHAVFTDHAAFAPQLQTAGLMTARDRNALVGALDPARSIPAVRDLVRTFFARHLPPR
ncbi:acetylhydrolase [Streptomyces sp. NRRL S-1448]|uniref:acetylhydrolase n=1 Tax=Streptomyces sp. NRRL S-1448 TaxID=1463883 RepID=UPI00068CF812|nr:acetylhydrolase [Streptomyces sp. NRRL S-1448]